MPHPLRGAPGWRARRVALAALAGAATMTSGACLAPSDPAPSPVGLSRTPGGDYQAVVPRCDPADRVLSVEVRLLVDGSDRTVWAAEEPRDPAAFTIHLGDADAFARIQTDAYSAPASGELTVAVRTEDRTFMNFFQLATVTTTLNGGADFDDADITAGELTDLACDQPN